MRADQPGARPRCSQCGWEAPERIGADPVGDAPPARTMCGTCGTQFEGEPDPCVVCGSRSPVRAPTPRLDPAPAALVPFSLSAEDCRQGVARWLSRSWLHPRGLAQMARPDRMRAAWLPVWVFGAAVDSEWRAQVGVERVERTYDPRNAQWETAAETDWRWQTGRLRAGSVRCVGGVVQVPEPLLSAVGPDTDLADAVPITPIALGGHPVLGVDRSLAEAWEQARSVVLARARADARAAVPSPRIRDLTVATDLGDESWRLVLLPVFLGTWRSREGTHLVLCHGRSGEVAGTRLLDWRKVKLTLALLLGPGVAMTLVGVPLLVVFAIGVPVMLFGLFLLSLGAVASTLVWSAALGAETS